jgi:hypothetical protein
MPYVYVLSGISNKEYCDSLSDDEFDKEVQDNPREALECGHVCVRMSDAQFDYCIKEDYSWAALNSEHVKSRLTSYQKAWLRKEQS